MSTKSTTVTDKFNTGWLSELDGRTGIAQVMRERYQSFTADLGGADLLSYAQRSLCERAIWLEYWIASQERELAENKAFDVSRWTQATNSLQGIFSKLGLERQARNVPDLQDFIKEKSNT